MQIDCCFPQTTGFFLSFSSRENHEKILNIWEKSPLRMSDQLEEYELGLLKMTSDHQINDFINPNSNFYECYHPYMYYQTFQHFPAFFYHNLYNPMFLENEVSIDLTQLQEEQNQYLNQIPLEDVKEDCLKPEKPQKNKKKKRTDVNYLNKYQKEDRNLNSIVLRNFVNFVNSHPRVSDSIQLIISSKKLSITAQKYLELFRENLPSKQSYVGVNKMKTFIDMGNENNAIKIITLILLRKFINTDFFTVLINSKKVSKSAREKELKHGKIFWKFFVEEVL